ncbi:MAG TPA: hypothetical protein P5279_05665 [Anaerohalosphaeraceae bacterium]|jgi:DNA-directed RNA polymerase subunit RPC12/RpoP|nr:hypothetical protein [Anaerohalosphaeraceae bacterium]HRT49959.1 hypothetical protein [Anaerohalosphaeraceae bacterium]HRT85743.1 hypothetical protein [Anaerohalosphaeraceae bacterium]
MQLLARCPRCGQILQLDVSAADRRIGCPACGRKFRVPDIADLDRALAVARKARNKVYIDEEGNTYA